MEQIRAPRSAWPFITQEIARIWTVPRRSVEQHPRYHDGVGIGTFMEAGLGGYSTRDVEGLRDSISSNSNRTELVVNGAP